MRFLHSPRLKLLGLTLCLIVAFIVLLKNPALPRHSPEPIRFLESEPRNRRPEPHGRRLAEGRRRVPPAESKSSIDCITKTEKREVRGESLSPLITSGQTIQILYGYYHCHAVERGDLVVYDYAGDSAPIIKIVKGIAADRFELRKTKQNCWNLLINGQVVKNSEGKSYCFDEHRYKMLSLYERDYHGLIPQHSYLILGNLIGGTTDSSRFGLVGISDLIGKAIKSER